MNIIGAVAIIEDVIARDLRGANIIAMMPNASDELDKPDEGYWERSFIVVWQRKVMPHQRSLDEDGFTYATHRVQVNSEGRCVAIEGHYDQSRYGAIYDMMERARIRLLPDVDKIVTKTQALSGIISTHLRLSGANFIVGIVNDDTLAMELDVRQLGFDHWYVSDDDGEKHHGSTLVEAILNCRAINSNKKGT